MPDPRYKKRKSLLGRAIDGALVRTFRAINQHRPWHKIGKWPGVANLLALRIDLRRYNLHDTDSDLTVPKRGCPFHEGPNGTHKRTEEGTHNDLANPAMGCRFSRLGRNMRTLVPLDQEKGLLDPDPFEISKKILQREPGKFIPATSLNLLAAAWIQFQVHDWFGHENEELAPNDDDTKNIGKKIEVPQAGDWKHGTMVIPKTKPDDDNWPDRSEWPDPNRPPPINSRYPAYRSKNPQWWDASQVYGESTKETLRLRTDPANGQLCPRGRLYLDDQGLLPVEKGTEIPLTGFNDNWWLGLEILHTLFAKEHNFICEALKLKEPHLTDQEIFETARLINCAVMAKIHTVEWTPGIIAHPSIQPALDANWMGLVGHICGSEKPARALAAWLPNGFIKDVLTGVPMSETDHHGAPYSLTEEFNSVYRLHPLIPDHVKVKVHGTQKELGTYEMIDIAFRNSRTPFNKGATMLDAIYSFGIANPGAVVAKNYPNFLRDLSLPQDPNTGREQVLDLAAVDIIRDRERGVPRYCEFRRQLRMPVPKTWKELAGAFDGSREEEGFPNLEPDLCRIYKDDLEAVDNMVGMFLEQPPDKFGFSDTAFRIFILMASRRLKSDRFFTEDYTEEFYTKTGLEWIADTGMKTVILRHHPELESNFKPGANPFEPWQSGP